MSVGKMDYLSKLEILVVFHILNGTAKTKLAKLALLYCREIVIVKNSIVSQQQSNKYFLLMVRKIFLCICVLIMQPIPPYLICVLTIQRYKVTP